MSEIKKAPMEADDGIPTQSIHTSEELLGNKQRRSLDSQRASQQAYRYLCHVQEAKEYRRVPKFVCRWIESVLEEQLDCSVAEFEARLQNGVILAKVARRLCPSAVPRIHDPPGRPLEFRHSDNISHFFAALRSLSFPRHFDFELVDLYDRKNMPRVIYCIHVVSRFLSRANMAPQMGKADGIFDEHEIARKQSELADLHFPAFDRIDEALMQVPVAPEEEAPFPQQEMPASLSRESIEGSSQLPGPSLGHSASLEQASTSLSEQPSTDDDARTDSDSVKDIQPEEEPSLRASGAASVVQAALRAALASSIASKRSCLVVELQRLFRAWNARLLAVSLRRERLAMQALLRDRSCLAEELDQKLILLREGSIDAFQYGMCSAERARLAVLHRPAITMATTRRPSINDLGRLLLKQHSLIRCVPPFFNYGRGGGEAAWTELVVSLASVSREMAKEVLLGILSHSLLSVALQRSLSSELSIRDAIDAFMNLVCSSPALLRIIQHTSMSESFYFLGHYSSTLHAAFLSAIWQSKGEDNEAEFIRAWRLRLRECIAKFQPPPPGKTNFICYLEPELATALNLYCPPTQMIAFVDSAAFASATPEAKTNPDEVKRLLSSYNEKIAAAVTVHPARSFWAKLIGDNFGTQPSVVKKWRSACMSLPKHGLYARSLEHLIGKQVLTVDSRASSAPIDGQSAVVFWSDRLGEYRVQVGESVETVYLDALLQQARVCLHGSLDFDVRNLVRILTTKLVVCQP